FGVSNYVKLLCDHARSVLKASIRSVSVEEFFRRSEEFIRDSILGRKPEDGGQRSGMQFEENGMRGYDVEVLNVTIGDSAIQQLLQQVQHESVRTTVELSQEERRLTAIRKREQLKQEEARVVAETADLKAKLEI